MIKCPFCFVGLDGKRRGFVCSSGACQPKKDEVQSSLLGKEVLRPPFQMIEAPADPKEAKNWSPPEVVPCRECRGSTAPACPYCHYVLPVNFYQSRLITVALSGARATGKSMYIAVLKRQLERLVADLGSYLSLAPDQATEFRDRYETPLESEMGLVVQTAAMELQDAPTEPFVLSLGQIGGKLTYLALRDISGEDLEKGTEAPILSYFSRADLVIFLWDPLADQTIRSALEGLIPQQREVSTARPEDVLNVVKRRVGDGDPRLAVVMSKFDLVHQFENSPNHPHGSIASNRGAAYMRNSRSDARGVDFDDLDLIDAETRSMLLRFRAVNVVNAIANPARGKPYNARFFVTSALGAAPEGDKQDRRGIAPFRCLDPIFWVLADTKVM